MSDSNQEQPEQCVYIVDDDDAVRDSLDALMRSIGLPATTFASGAECLEGVDAHSRGCLVLDIRMPGMSGLELQAELNRRGIELPVIFITGHADVPMAVQAMQQGATDFLEKPYRDQDLIDRINGTLNEQQAKSERDERRRAIRVRLEQLTPRELEVARRIAQGQANKVIAIELDVSQRTVEIHRSRVMDKMGARSLADLVRYMLLAGELEAES